MAREVIKIKITLSIAIPGALLALALAGMLTCTVAWFVLLTRILAAPPKPTPDRSVPYNNHGQTLYITPLEESLRTWLPLGGMFFGTTIFGTALWARIAWAKQQAEEQK